jgi:methyltransferase (TIGR00027 family)
VSEGKRSVLAERLTIGRVLHERIDPKPVIFSDPLAQPLMGEEGERYIEKNLTWLRAEGMRRTRALVSLRSRFAEDELLRAVSEGARQYVILGAGGDTFAYRRPDLAPKLTVYEVDHPATQHWKRERLAAAGIAVPDNLRFVPLDFNERTLAEGLGGAGFDRGAPAFFSWLGVTYYLPPESVMETLRFVASQRAARQIVFDYALDSEALPEQFRDIVGRVRGYTAASGEPWVSFFAPDPLVAELRAMGFASAENIEANPLLERYTGVADDLTPMVALMSARGS